MLTDNTLEGQLEALGLKLIEDPNHMRELLEKNPSLMRKPTESGHIDAFNKSKWEPFNGENNLTGGMHLLAMILLSETTLSPKRLITFKKEQAQDLYKILSQYDGFYSNFVTALSINE